MAIWALSDATRAGNLLVSYRPGQISREVLAQVDVLVGLRSDNPDDNADLVATAVSLFGPAADGFASVIDQAGRGRVGLVTRGAMPVLCDLVPRAGGHVRHWHKYAIARLPEWLRFYWRAGTDRPVGRAAANMAEFRDGLSGCEPAELRHHGRHGDFSRWVADVVGDVTLANRIRSIEAQLSEAPDDAATDAARRQLLAAVEDRYLG